MPGLFVKINYLSILNSALHMLCMGSKGYISKKRG